jgi:hypothetical protein
MEGDSLNKHRAQKRAKIDSGSTITDSDPFDWLPANRQKICTLFAECLTSEETEFTKSRALAIEIEQSVENLYGSSEDDGGKGYTVKARSLLYNLRRNEDLRAAIIRGEVQPSSLAQLSSEDLATEEVKGRRKKLTALDIMEHRKDVHIVRAATGDMVAEVVKNDGGEAKDIRGSV